MRTETAKGSPLDKIPTPPPLSKREERGNKPRELVPKVVSDGSSYFEM